MSSEVLSQNEIDALLSALSTGEMSADELKKEESEKKRKRKKKTEQSFRWKYSLVNKKGNARNRSSLRDFLKH